MKLQDILEADIIPPEELAKRRFRRDITSDLGKQAAATPYPSRWKKSGREEDDVTRFPKKFKKSRIIGKTPEGYDVEIDEITGSPCVVHKGICYFVDPETFELGPEFDPKATMEPEWIIVNRQTDQAISTHSSKREAELAAERLRRWEGRDVDVIEI